MKSIYYYYLIHSNYCTYILYSMANNFELLSKKIKLNKFLDEQKIPNKYKECIRKLFNSIDYHLIIDNSFSTINQLYTNSNNQTTIYNEIKNITNYIFNLSKFLDKNGIDILFLNNQLEATDVNDSKKLDELFNSNSPINGYLTYLSENLNTITNKITKLDKTAHYIIILTDGENTNGTDKFYEQIIETLKNENIYVMVVVVNKDRDIIDTYKDMDKKKESRLDVKLCYEDEKDRNKSKDYTLQCYLAEIVIAAYYPDISKLNDNDNYNKESFLKTCLAGLLAGLFTVLYIAFLISLLSFIFTISIEYTFNQFKILLN